MGDHQNLIVDCRTIKNGGGQVDFEYQLTTSKSTKINTISVVELEHSNLFHLFGDPYANIREWYQ